MFFSVCHVSKPISAIFMRCILKTIINQSIISSYSFILAITDNLGQKIFTIQMSYDE